MRACTNRCTGAAVIGALVLGEELSLVHYLGIAVVMASIVMISGGDARVS